MEVKAVHVFLALALTGKQTAYPKTTTKGSHCNAGPQMIRGHDDCESHHSPRSKLLSSPGHHRMCCQGGNEVLCNDANKASSFSL